MNTRTATRIDGAFAPGLPVLDERVIALDQPLRLDSGVMLEGVRVGMRQIGPAGAPRVLVLGGISADRRAVTQAGEGVAGWWQKALDSTGADILASHRVLGFDYLGGCGATTAPHNWGHPQHEFPAVTARDQARLAVALLDQLGGERVDGVIGASYGGMVALQLASHWPARIKRVLVLACAHRAEPMARARRHAQKKILALAGAGADEAAAVAAARALAMTTYRSPAEFRQRFAGPNGAKALTGWLDHHGQRFAGRIGAIAYARLIDSIDTHAVDPATLTLPLALVGFGSDEICPPALMRELADRAPGAAPLIEIPSPYGHDAFLCEAQAVADVVRDFLRGGAS